MIRQHVQSIAAIVASSFLGLTVPCVAADRDVIAISPTSSIVGGTPFSIDANSMALGGGTYVLHTGGRTTLRPTTLKFGAGFIDLNEHLMIVPRTASISYQSGGPMLLTTGSYTSPGLTISGTVANSGTLVVYNGSGITKSGKSTLTLIGAGSMGISYDSRVIITAGTFLPVTIAPVRTWAPEVPPPPIPQTFPSTELRRVRSNLANGENSQGAIGSTLVSTHPDRLGIGLAVAEDLDLPGKYARRDIVSGDLIVRAALLGDANLDGRVDKYDIRRLEQQFLSTDRRWSWGDFDHDGNVNLNDFALLTRNYGMSLNDVIGQTELPRSRGVLTPEPAVGTMAVVVMGLIRRRR